MSVNPLETMQRAYCAYTDGDWAVAERLCLETVDAHASHADALNLLGIIAAQSARPRQAVAFLQRVLQVEPANHAAHYNLGNVLRELRQWEDAAHAFRQAVAANPGFAEAWNALGWALQQDGRLEQALESYERAVALRPAFCEAHYNRGCLLNALDRSKEAWAAYSQLLVLDAKHAEAYNNRGVTAKRLGRLADALADYEAAVRIKTDYAEAWNNRGNLLHELHRWQEALDSYERALRSRPAYADAHGNRGTTLHELGRFDEALACYAHALALRPADPLILVNRGATLQAMRRWTDAIDSYQNALSLQPDYPDAHWNLALCHLLQGNFLQGWPGYEWRARRAGRTATPRRFAQPLWLGGTALRGRRILLHCEQGFGDAIQFCRYAQQVSDLGAYVILEAPPALMPLFRQLGGVAQLVGRGGALPAFDCHCPLMSLPLAFRTDAASIPAPPRYVHADPARLQIWRDRLGDTRGPRVGLVWNGSPTHRNDHQRSITLARLVAALPAGIQYVSLQKELRPTDVTTLRGHPEIIHFGDALGDFGDTAALCDLMDVVISVDTSVAHLAGALGRPLWLLLSDPPEWRWLLDRDDSPWYPGARLLRQPRPGDWESVLATVRSELLKLISTSATTPPARS